MVSGWQPSVPVCLLLQMLAVALLSASPYVFSLCNGNVAFILNILFGRECGGREASCGIIHSSHTCPLMTQPVAEFGSVGALHCPIANVVVVMRSEGTIADTERCGCFLMAAWHRPRAK